MRRLLLTLACSVLYIAPAQAGYMMGFTPFGTQTLIVTTTAGVVEIEAFDHGWYESDGTHSPGNDNYVVCTTGEFGCTGKGLAVNDFFAFRLGTIEGDFLSAQLSVGNPSSGYLGPASMTMSLFDFTGDVDDLLDGTGGVSAFTDLGSGVLYSSRLVSDADENTQVVFNLNAAALAAIEAALNQNQGSGLFVIGGTLEELAVPEPTTVGLIAAGLGLIAIGRRRRNQRG